MANGDFDYQKFLTGIDPAGGGKDRFGRDIPGLIPGGGALSGLGQVAGGIADIAGANKDFKRARNQEKGARKAKRPGLALMLLILMFLRRKETWLPQVSDQQTYLPCSLCKLLSLLLCLRTQERLWVGLAHLQRELSRLLWLPNKPTWEES